MTRTALGNHITGGDRLRNLAAELKAAGYTKPVKSLSIIYDASDYYKRNLGDLNNECGVDTGDKPSPGMLLVGYCRDGDLIEEVYMGLDHHGDKVIFIVNAGDYDGCCRE